MARLLFISPEDWFFCSHFLPLARAARAAGFEVSVVTRVSKHGETITREGVNFIPLDADRSTLGPLRIIKATARLTALIAQERPDIVHCITLRSVVLGGIAAKRAGVRGLVLAPTGLGHLWIEDDPAIRILRAVTRALVGWLARAPTRLIFENRDDYRDLGFDGRFDGQVTFVGGAGVDAAAFVPQPQPPAPPVKIAVVARMLATKGISESVEAIRLARSRGTPVELHLFGVPDPVNKRSLSPDQLKEWAAEPGIVWHGATSDIAAVWRDHHIALLLSFREGTPRSLVEAAACGRPIIATDVPGCREIVVDRKTGLLVPRGNIRATADAIGRLAEDAALRREMGGEGRRLFEERFTEVHVTSAVMDVYRQILRAQGAAAV